MIGFWRLGWPRLVLAAALAFASGFVSARADDYPTRPVRIIVGFGPGSAGDTSARLVGQKVGQLLGQQFVVEARPGGGSNIAAEFGVRSPKDGYTLLLGNIANTVSAALSPNPSFDFARARADRAGDRGADAAVGASLGGRDHRQG